MPKVSVIIPTYNRRLLVQEAIESVLCQSYHDYEIIVVDDGSTDGTFEDLATYRNKIAYIYQENAGESAARQKAIQASSGMYLAFLDSDDIWLPDMLKKQVAALEHYSAGFSFCWTHKIDSNGTLIDRPPSGMSLQPDQLTLGSLTRENFFMPTSALLVSRDSYDASGGFDSNVEFGEDWDLCLKLAAISTFTCVPEPLINYRVYDRGMLKPRDQVRQMLQDHLRILDNFFGRKDIASSRIASGKPLAQSHRYAFAAVHHFAYGDLHAGKTAFSKAFELAPDVWGNPVFFQRYVAERSTLLIRQKNYEPAIDFGICVGNHLPDELMRIGITRNSIQGWTHMTVAHYCRQTRDIASMRQHILRAMRCDPSWIGNRGALSWLRKSIFAGQELKRSHWSQSISASRIPWVADITIARNPEL